MSSLHVCFNKYPVKSQPEVGLSQDLFDFGQIGHDLATNPTYNIPIPPNTMPQESVSHQRPELNSYALSSFGSFSSVADSLVQDNAIVIPAYSPVSTPATSAAHDFCLLEDQDPVLILPPSSSSSATDSSSMALLSSSTCESDISFCSPTTPMSSMLSPYGFSVDDMMMMSSPRDVTSSPGTWLAHSMQNDLTLHSPSSPASQFGLFGSCSPDMRGMDQQTLYSTFYSTPSPLPQHLSLPEQQHHSLASTSITMMNQQQPQNTTTCTIEMEMMECHPVKMENQQQAGSQSVILPKKKKSTTRRREYQCPHCPRKSNRSNNMKEHILTHNPNRPKNFPCTICPKRFARKHDLKRHHQSHERNIEKMMVACGLVPGASP